jgi:PadR family transcriptional regulator, regulatory protein PadR
MNILSRAEELVLLAVWRLQKDAYGVAVRRYIMERTGEDWSIGAIYVPLDRLTEMGYLLAVQADPTPQRGGRSKRYYRLSKPGLDALQKTRRVQDAMWARLPKLNLGTK